MRFTRPLAALAVLLAALVLGACSRATPTATPTLPSPTAEPTTPPTPGSAQTSESVSATVTTVATGLRFPRGLAFGPDGSLYVAEAGSGGDIETMGTCDGFTSIFAPYHTGPTSRISRIAPDGTRTTIVDNLPSARHQYGDVQGVNDVAFLDGTLYALYMGGGCSRGLADFPAGVLRVEADGTVTRIADLSAFYAANPTAAPPEDDWEPDGSAYAMVAYDGAFYVVNANHGGFEAVSPDGAIRRVLDISASEGHVTPAALTVHDGNFYIGALGGYPIRQGASKVYRVTPQGEWSVYAEGLTAVLGLAFDAQARLYVLETSTVDDALPQPGAGRVVRVAAGGGPEVIASGLTFPTGMTTGPDGDLYVSQFGYGDDATLGEIVRVDITP